MEALRISPDGSTGPTLEFVPKNARRQNPAAASAPGGGFVVWEEYGGEDWEVLRQRFRSDGAAVTAPFQVNTYTTGDQLNAEIATLANGQAVVTWQSEGSADSDFDGASIDA